MIFPRVRLARAGRLDYLTLEYLAELTMSILAVQRAKDPAAGFATDFLDVLDRLAPTLQAQPNLKVITNDGGLNQAGCAANAMGVRTANVITHAPYHGVQLHPRDCRAAFIELNHTDGSDDILGVYPPAGPDWQKSITKDTTLALTGVEMQSPDPQGLAEHWGKILQLAVGKGADGEPEVKLPNADFRFVKGPSDLMSGLTFRVANVAKVRDAAKAKGCKVLGDGFELCGVTFKLVA